MIHTKLIGVLSVMTESELKLLEKFIKSPFFNESKMMTKLYMYLRKQAPEWKSEKLDKQKVWAHLLPKEPYNDVRFRQFCSLLFQLVETFIAQFLQFSQQQKYANLITFYQSRYLTKESQVTFSKWSEMQAKNPLENEAFFQEKIQYLQLKMLQPNETNLIVDFLKTSSLHFILTQLRWQTVLFSNAGILHNLLSSPFFDAILQEISQNPIFLETPAIAIYYYLYKMIENKDNSDNYYEQVNHHLSQHASVISQEEKVYIAVYLRNYCTRKILAGDSHFYEKSFLLHQKQLVEGTLFSANHIKVDTFKNIVSLAIRNEAYDWAMQFIEDYQNRLEEHERENLVLLCRAMIFFAQKKYDLVLQSLHQTQKFDNIFAELNVKTLKIRTFYEIGETETLLAAIEALKVYISREEKLSEFYKLRYKNFANFLYRMSQLANFEVDKWQKLAKELAEIEGNKILHKDWIEKKIHQRLIGKYP